MRAGERHLVYTEEGVAGGEGGWGGTTGANPAQWAGEFDGI